MIFTDIRTNNHKHVYLMQLCESQDTIKFPEHLEKEIETGCL